MALKLAKANEKPAARRVEIGGGVALWVRPAEYPESIAAAERIMPMVIALREGSEAAAQVAALLGPEFDGARLDDDQLAAAANKLALMELVALTCERIEGELVGEDDQPITHVDMAVAGALVRDIVVAHRLRAVIEGPLHEVIAEKNGSAALPHGGAGSPDTAPDAAKAEQRVH